MDKTGPNKWKQSKHTGHLVDKKTATLLKAFLMVLMQEILIMTEMLMYNNRLFREAYMSF